MPHDLFGDVVARPSSVRSRRSPLVFISLGAHAVLVAGVIVTSIVAPEALPFPTKAIAWEMPVVVKMMDIPLPKQPKSIERAVAPSASARALESVAPLPPVTAPDGLRPETGRETPDFGRGGPVTTAGIGDSGDIDGIGITTVEPAPVGPTPRVVPVRLHSGIRTPRKIVDVAPVYPELARRIRQEGVVILEATIDAVGVVQSASVLRSVPYLDHAAIDAVRQWRFEPARLNDQPIPVIMTITVRFTLR